MLLLVNLILLERAVHVVSVHLLLYTCVDINPMLSIPIVTSWARENLYALQQNKTINTTNTNITINSTTNNIANTTRNNNTTNSKNTTNIITTTQPTLE